MPSGVTHDRITLWILPWVAGITYGFTSNGDLTLILSGGFLFSGMMFGPDLDIDSIQYKRWSIIRRIWLPYRQCLRHRSVLSHGPIIGTCLRITYLLVFIAIVSIFVVAIAQLCFGFTWNWQDFFQEQLLLLRKYPKQTIALIVGLEIGAMSHSISDWIASSRQRYLKKKYSKNSVATRQLRKTKIYQKKK